MSYMSYKDSQKIKIKKRQRLPGSLMKGGIPRNSCLTQKMKERTRRKKGQEERKDKKKEKTPVSSSKAHFWFSSPIGFFTE